jgi:hypothetical protein|tara:strand:+ start:413 stop:619 length:207 start_codon:yes stop_codon:yes gene_type:complete
MAEKRFMGINPKHKGYCTPMTKSTCTPRRKALAIRLKPGGDLYKKREGGQVQGCGCPYSMEMGPNNVL